MRSLRPSLDWLLVLVPVSIVLELAGGNELLIFLTRRERSCRSPG